MRADNLFIFFAHHALDLKPLRIPRIGLLPLEVQELLQMFIGRRLQSHFLGQVLLGPLRGGALALVGAGGRWSLFFREID